MAQQYVPKKEKCPVCDTKWTKTSFGSATWYDCSKCNKKAEDLENSSNKNSTKDKSFKIGDIEEWEAFIDALDYDDFDMPFLKITKAQKYEICNELIAEGVITTPEEYMDWLEGV